MLAIVVCGCTIFSHKKTIVFDCQDVKNHVGDKVILIGELIDHKRPMVLGVLVGQPNLSVPLQTRNPEKDDLAKYLSELTSNHAVVYRRVSAEGVIIRGYKVEQSDPFSPFPMTNAWYELVNPWTGDLANFEIIEE